jgi:hypothetical protein
MKRMIILLQIAHGLLVFGIAGCTSARPSVSGTSLQTPVQVQFGGAGSAAEPLRIRPGQLISLPLCCPPVELRNADGKRVRELKCAREPQPLMAGTGAYSIVGHDPVGGECVLRVEVTGQ